MLLFASVVGLVLVMVATVLGFRASSIGRHGKARRYWRASLWLLVVGVLPSVAATVFALYRVFVAVRTSDAAEKARLLANGISEAMNCTAYTLGLIILFGAGCLAGRVVARSKGGPSDRAAR